MVSHRVLTPYKRAAQDSTLVARYEDEVEVLREGFRKINLDERLIMKREWRNATPFFDGQKQI